MEETSDPFTVALAKVMSEAGFKVYRAFAPGDAEDRPIEALLLARSVDSLEKAALDVLTTRTKAVD
jgi:hypothetical protein